MAGTLRAVFHGLTSTTYLRGSFSNANTIPSYPMMPLRSFGRQSRVSPGKRKAVAATALLLEGWLDAELVI